MGEQTVQPSPAQAVAALAAGLAVAAYPFAAEAALARFGVVGVASAVLTVAAATLVTRIALDRSRALVTALEHAGAILLAGCALLTGERLWLMLFPVLVNATLCVVFLSSLRREPCIVELVASWIEPYLPDFTRSYCRGITLFWSAFFALAALGIGWVALVEPRSWQAATVPWYFGTVALLSIGEFAFRKIWFRHYTSRRIDKLFAHFFPADRTKRGRRSLAYIQRMRELGYHQD